MTDDGFFADVSAPFEAYVLLYMMNRKTGALSVSSRIKIKLVRAFMVCAAQIFVILQNTKWFKRLQVKRWCPLDKATEAFPVLLMVSSLIDVLVKLYSIR